MWPRGSSARRRRSSPSRSPARTSPARRHCCSSGAPSHAEKRVCFDSPALSSALRGGKQGFRRYGTCPSSGVVEACLAGQWETWQSWGADAWVVQVLHFGYQVPFRSLPPPLPCSAASVELQPFFHPWAGSVRCSCRPVGQGGYRACSSFARLLHPSLCDSQGHRCVAHGDRPLAPERLCGCLPFSYGDHPNRSSTPSGRGLVGVSGSPRCLPSGSGSSIFSPVPQVLRGRVGLPVLRSLFWPSTAPQVFTRIMALVSAIMHHHGFRILWYLDDWLVLASTFQESVRARDFLLWLCQRLGIRVNLPKSSLTPMQTQDYLGITVQTIPLRVFPTLKWTQKLSLLLQDFLSTRSHPVCVWRQLLGIMSSMSALVPGFRLHMRALQIRLNVAGRLQLDDFLVEWNFDCHQDLLWWSDVSYLQVGMPLGESLPDLCLFTDVSDTGWGSSLGDFHLSGSWSPLSSRFSINHRELLAVLLALRGFHPSLWGHVVAVFSDNTTALAYLKKQGGTRSTTLNTVAQSVLRFCEDYHIQLLPQFIPGKMNVLADSLSRKNQVIGSEWTLCGGVSPASSPLASHHQPLCDLPQSQVAGLLFPTVDPQSAGTDAMLQSWDGLQAYAFPPFGLLSWVLAKVRQSQGLKLMLIATFWPQHPWFPDFLELLVEIPSFLPRWRDLLKQPHFHHYHQNLHVLQLTAWRISSDPRAILDSLWWWLVSLPSAGNVPLV